MFYILNKLLPESVVIHIFEFNPEHRKKLKFILEDIKPISAIKRMDVISNIWEGIPRHNRPNFSFLCKLFINDPELLIDNLFKCKCCLRHSQNKPKNLNNNFWLLTLDQNYDTTYYHINHNKFCKCKCRHYSRFLFVAFGVNN